MSINYHQHIFIITALIYLALIIDISGLDLLLADMFYQLQNRHWELRDSYVTETLLHRGGRSLVELIAVIVLSLATASHIFNRLKEYRLRLWFLFLCLITGPALVAIAKAATHMDCPWSIEQFGGHYPYLHLLQRHPRTWPYGQCFPGGHSSGGFALIALYFAAVQYKPRWRAIGMSAGLLTGFLFGLTQQLRGAHFFSHDLWSLAICWISCLSLHYLLFTQPLLTLGRSA